MNIYDKTREIKELIEDTDKWGESNFAWRKSYISALFSSLAYEEIPEFELKSSKRAKVIPCDS
jgi:hypothetical protein